MSRKATISYLQSSSSNARRKCNWSWKEQKYTSRWRQTNMVLPCSSWSRRSWLELKNHSRRRWPSSWRKGHCIPSSSIWIHRTVTKRFSSMRTSRYWRRNVVGWAYPKHWLIPSWRNCTLWYRMWPRPTIDSVRRPRYRQEIAISNAWCWLGKTPCGSAGWRRTCSTATCSVDTGNPRQERML